MMACVISYVIVSFIHVINAIISKNTVQLDPLIVSGIASLIAIGFSLLLSIVFISKRFNNFMIKRFHKSLNDDIWRDVFNYDSGSNLKVYLKEKPYYIIGHYKLHEEKENNSWFAISAYSKIDKETNENYNNEPDFSERNDIVITIRLNDIEHIEIF